MAPDDPLAPQESSGPGAPTPPGTAKEPVVALILSLCFPGAGYAYAERPASFVRVAAITGVLYFLACSTGFPIWVPVLLHVFNAVASAGAVRERNRRLGLAGGTTGVAGVPPPPPPPPPGAARRPLREEAHPVRRSSLADLPPEPALPPLGPDEFLAELQDAWRAHRSGSLDDAAFAARRQTAIQRLRFDDEDDRAAVLEAAVALVDGGVLTPGDRRKIEAKGTTGR